MISEYISEENVEIQALKEIWLRTEDDPLINDLVLAGYMFLGDPRPTSKGIRGRGVGFVLKSDFAQTRHQHP